MIIIFELLSSNFDHIFSVSRGSRGPKMKDVSSGNVIKILKNFLKLLKT